MVFRKNIRSEVTPSDHGLGRFDSRPPGSLNEDGVLEPVRDQLLAGGLATSLTHLGGETGLGTASSGDSPLQSNDVGRDISNVVSLHAAYVTRKLVSVNKEACFTGHKETCTLLNMPTTKRKPAAADRPARKRSADPLLGPDGLTMSQRVVRLMEERDVNQSELARMCSKYLTAFIPADEDPVKQQHIFNIIQGQESSWVLPLIAAVFDVSDMWLQFGIGNPERKKN